MNQICTLVLLAFPMVACGGANNSPSNPANSGGAMEPPTSAALVAAVRASSIVVTSCVGGGTPAEPLGAAFAKRSELEKQGASRPYVEFGECTPASAPSDTWQTQGKSLEGAAWACTVRGTPDASAKPAAAQEEGGEEAGEDVGFSISFAVDANGAILPASVGCI